MRSGPCRSSRAMTNSLLVADHKDADSAVRPSLREAARFLPLVAGLGAIVVFLPALWSGLVG